MQLGMVIGHATATIKHPSFNGWRLVIVQPLNANREPEADCVVAVDKFSAGPGETVLINSDGKGAREYIGDEKSPARWFVVGIEDPKRAMGGSPMSSLEKEKHGRAARDTE